MTFSTRLVVVVVALLTAPIASRGQECDLPTQENVESAGGDYLTSELAEGGVSLTMTVHNMHFTCLATVALNKYSYASVVVNATSSAALSVPDVLQFQLECSSSNEWGGVGTSIFDSGVDDLSDPFNIETDVRCSECREVPISNYNATTNCRYCHPDCGNQFCTGSGSGQCCEGFNDVTGQCIDCATIDPNFGPNDDFICVCQITCEAGYTPNYTDCTCELTDGCEAYGQPCENGATCMSVVTASPPYSCQCVPGYTEENCTTFIPTVKLPPPTSATTASIPDCGEGCQDNQCISEDCCGQCRQGFEFSTDNCTCVPEPTTEPTRNTEPTGVCPSTCRDCDTDDPTCCTACLDGYTLRSCECVEDEGERSLAASQVAGIAVGLLLFILLILALAVLLAYVIYYFYDNKQKMKKGTPLAPFSNGESHSNPLYLGPEEVAAGDD